MTMDGLLNVQFGPNVCYVRFVVCYASNIERFLLTPKRAE